MAAIEGDRRRGTPILSPPKRPRSPEEEKTERIVAQTIATVVDYPSPHTCGTPLGTKKKKKGYTPPKVKLGFAAVGRFGGSPGALRRAVDGVRELDKVSPKKRKELLQRYRRCMQRHAEAQAGMAGAGAPSTTSPEKPPTPSPKYHGALRKVLRESTELRVLHAQLRDRGSESIGAPVDACHILGLHVVKMGSKILLKGFHFCLRDSEHEKRLVIKFSNPKTGVYYALYKHPSGSKKWSSFFPQSILSDTELLALFGKKKKIAECGTHAVYTMPNGVYFIGVSNDGFLSFDTIYPLFEVQDYVKGKPLSFELQTTKKRKPVILEHDVLCDKVKETIEWHLGDKSDKSCYVLQDKERLLVNVSYNLIKKQPITGGVWIIIPMSLLGKELETRFKKERMSEI